MTTTWPCPCSFEKHIWCCGTSKPNSTDRCFVVLVLVCPMAHPFCALPICAMHCKGRDPSYVVVCMHGFFCLQTEHESRVLTFKAASDAVSSSGGGLGDTAKLQLYGLYKQGTVGPCRTSRPSMMDMVNRAKWYCSWFLSEDHVDLPRPSYAVSCVLVISFLLFTLD